MSAEQTAADQEIRELVTRLARPHPSGGDVVERAALLASGGDFEAVMIWITDHAGVAEAMAVDAPRRGLHGSRIGISDTEKAPVPRRFVLPAGTLG